MTVRSLVWRSPDWAKVAHACGCVVILLFCYSAAFLPRQQRKNEIASIVQWASVEKQVGFNFIMG